MMEVVCNVEVAALEILLASRTGTDKMEKACEMEMSVRFLQVIFYDFI